MGFFTMQHDQQSLASAGIGQVPPVSACSFRSSYEENPRIPLNDVVFPSVPAFSVAGGAGGGGSYLQGIPFDCGRSPLPGRFLGFDGCSCRDVTIPPLDNLDVKAATASKSHSEAERRRRERINSHLATLRTLLPSTTKTDKASLLAEVIRHVRELKRRIPDLAEFSLIPTEADEVSVLSGEPSSDGRPVIRASFCCDYRTDILPELIKTLKMLRLRTLKAEIATLGGRMVNVLFVTGEEDSAGDSAVGCIQEAIRAVVERPSGENSGGKRQRMERRMG